jgi:V/A-type H+-transporting ATPase subunit A
MATEEGAMERKASAAPAAGKGKIIKVSGPVVEADGMRGTKMYDVARVGNDHLIGEVIEIMEDTATVQVYEDTTGIAPGEVVHPTGAPLSVELGPGLIGQIYDGIQRPLPRIMETAGDFIPRGVSVPPLDYDKKWHFIPVAKVGNEVEEGGILGTVQESPVVLHKIMVPPDMFGKIDFIASEGEYTLKDTVAKVKTDAGTKDIAMVQKWGVRTARPVVKKFDPVEPLITGQRILDTFFPITKGGTAAIPGGFGTGKTVTQHQLAKWCDADIIVYVGCGERGNEMTDVLREFPELEDPRTGEKLMKRTVLIANTSNMPVAAREASVYTGITIAEYYRDMGYNVALMADSTSRWAEAMREISGRLEEMPGEEGYPAYLASRLASFYERGGYARVLGPDERMGAISVIGAVSPPGGDFSEPVAQNTLRIVKVFWALDSDLADRRHFPSINWLKSYSLYLDHVKPVWHEKVAKDWYKLRQEAMWLLQKEEELQEIVKLVGPDALPPGDQAILEGARIIREDFLRQNAFHEVDTYCPMEKQYEMVRIMLEFYNHAAEAVKGGISMDNIREMACKEIIARMAVVDNKNFEPVFKKVEQDMLDEFKSLGGTA